MGFLTKTCKQCHGSGEIWWRNRWIPCPTCKGKGVT